MPIHTSTEQVLIASDHAGFALKERLKKNLADINWLDLGPANDDRVDYPDYADLVAKRIQLSPEGKGILICGSGQGMSIRANRYLKVRAALAWSEESAKLSREHNDANILSLGARLLAPEVAEKIVHVFLQTEFAGGRHGERVQKLDRPTN